MPTVQLIPHLAALGPQQTAQVCYLLLTISADGDTGARPINWAFVADASRSMRIPIVDEAQFRALIRESGAQETVIDGVPVWQLSAPVPPEIRANAKNALDHVAHALHTILERLDGEDRFALIASASESLVLNRSVSGSERAALARGIGQISQVNLGDETNLASGIALGLDELRRGRNGLRADRMFLLTDGFTQAPEHCIRLVTEATAEGVSVTTIGLGGEFQSELLTALADLSGGRALFLPRANEIAAAVVTELQAARAVATRGLTVALKPSAGATIRRVTRVRPALSVLAENTATQHLTLRPGDISNAQPLGLLIEVLAPADAASRTTLLEIEVATQGIPPTTHAWQARRFAQQPAPSAEIRTAAGLASIARFEQRAHAAVQAGQPAEAARLFAVAADRLTELGETGLAQAVRLQADALATTGSADTLTIRELTYATRRLGENELGSRSS